MKEKLLKIFWITLGSFIFSFGSYFFLVKHNIAAGGVTGLAMVASDFLPFFSVGVWSLLLNTFLFILAFWKLGKQFGTYSLYSSTLLSIFIIIFERTFKKDFTITNDMVLNMIFGSLLGAVGLSIVFYNNATTGGSDIIAALVNKYFDLSITKCLYLVDTCIVILAFYSYGIEKGLYALVVIAMMIPIMDYLLIAKDRKVQIVIITEHVDEVNDLILNKYDRGVTLLHGEGGYSKEDKKIIMSILLKSQYAKIKQDIEKIDDKAFVFTNYVSEIYGEGFTYDTL